MGDSISRLDYASSPHDNAAPSGKGSGYNSLEIASIASAPAIVSVLIAVAFSSSSRGSCIQAQRSQLPLPNKKSLYAAESFVRDFKQVFPSRSGLFHLRVMTDQVCAGCGMQNLVPIPYRILHSFLRSVPRDISQYKQSDASSHCRSFQNAF